MGNLEYERHPASAAWGDMPEAQFEELVADIARNGLLQTTIWLHEGKVIDGWHRYKAALAAGEDMYYMRTWGKDENPNGIATVSEFLVSQNAHRRHLTASERAIAIAACLAMEGDSASESQADLAASANMSKRTLQQGVRVEKAGLAEHVQSGEISVRGGDDIVSAKLDGAVREGKIAPAEAAKVARSTKAKASKDEPGSPRKARSKKARTMTAAEQVEAGARSQLENVIESLKEENLELRDRNTELEDRAVFLEGEASPHDHEREATFNKQTAVIRALKSELDTEKTQHEDTKRQLQALRARLATPDPDDDIEAIYDYD